MCDQLSRLVKSLEECGEQSLATQAHNGDNRNNDVYEAGQPVFAWRKFLEFEGFTYQDISNSNSAENGTRLEDLRRNVNIFLEEFEKRAANAIAAGCPYSNTLLAFKLLEKMGLWRFQGIEEFLSNANIYLTQLPVGRDTSSHCMDTTGDILLSMAKTYVMNIGFEGVENENVEMTDADIHGVNLTGESHMNGQNPNFPGSCFNPAIFSDFINFNRGSGQIPGTQRDNLFPADSLHQMKFDKNNNLGVESAQEQNDLDISLSPTDFSSLIGPSSAVDAMPILNHSLKSKDVVSVIQHVNQQPDFAIETPDFHRILWDNHVSTKNYEDLKSPINRSTSLWATEIPNAVADKTLKKEACESNDDIDNGNKLNSIESNIGTAIAKRRPIIVYSGKSSSKIDNNKMSRFNDSNQLCNLSLAYSDDNGLANTSFPDCKTLLDSVSPFRSDSIDMDPSQLLELTYNQLTECSDCLFVGNSFDSLTKHVVKEHTNVPCRQCNFVASEAQDLRDHMSSSHGRSSTVCDVCHADFVTWHNLLGHVRSFHTEPSSAINALGENGGLAGSKCIDQEAERRGEKRPACIVYNPGASRNLSKEDLRQYSYDSPRHFFRSEDGSSASFQESFQESIKSESLIDVESHNGHAECVNPELIKTEKTADFLCSPNEQGIMDTTNYKISMKCDEANISNSSVSIHIDSSKARPYACNICEERFSLEALLNNHLHEVHDNSRVELATSDCQLKSLVAEDEMAKSSSEDNVLRCHICKKWFSTKATLDDHMELMHNKTKIKCDQCSKELSSMAVLRRHKRLVHQGVSFPCPVCKKKFAWERSCQKHVEKVHGDNAVEYAELCDQCGYKAKSRDSLTQHKRKVHFFKQLYSCPICDYAGKDQAELKAHITTIHEGKMLPCNQCSFLAPSLYALYRHRSLHRHQEQLDSQKDEHQKASDPKESSSSKEPLLTFKCNQCEFKCLSMNWLRAHKESKHLGVRYECKICGTRLTTKHGYTNHMIVKHGKGRHVCPICGYVSRSKAHLKTHQRGVHEKRFKVNCGLCDYSACNSTTLKIHILSKHEGVKFPCDQCPFQGDRARALQRHKEVHHELKRYPCDKCNYTAKDKQTVTIHQETKHDKVQYTCSECTLVFNSKYLLKKHKSSVHA